MTQQHPIIPPPELVEQWVSEFWGYAETGKADASQLFLATRAAQWGADQELEACCEWLKAKHWIEPEFADELRAARRTKPPSLKEQALLAIDTAVADYRIAADVANVVRRALEQLSDHE
jgi:hypothetical protein